jgi:peptide/nickel transport system permease protein
VLAFPGLVLAVGVVAMLGPGLANAMVAVGIVFAPSLAG